MVWTDGQRLVPSPTYAENPFRRAKVMKAGAKPWWSRVLWVIGGSRTTEVRIPLAAASMTKFSVSMR